MSRADLERMTVFVAGLGALATIGAFAFGGLSSAQGAAIGAVLAMLDFYLLRYIVGKVTTGDLRSQGFFSFVLFFKLFGFMGAIFGVVYSGLAEPIPFLFGISSLVGGLLIGSFLYILTPRPVMESEI